MILVPSSAFDMTLQWTYEELDDTALRTVETSISESLHSMQHDNPYLDIEVVVERVENVGFPYSTNLRFSVLATKILDRSSNVVNEKQALDLLITVTFTDSAAKNGFLKDIRSAAGLKNVTRFDVSPILQSEISVAPESHRSLSSLDLVLVSVSAFICLGIAYMLFEHHRDRGWLENQRMLTANEASHSPEHIPVYGRSPESVKSNAVEMNGMNGHSTNSGSPSSGLNAQESFSDRSRASCKRAPPRLTTVAQAMPSRVPVPLLPPPWQDVEPRMDTPKNSQLSLSACPLTEDKSNHDSDQNDCGSSTKDECYTATRSNSLFHIDMSVLDTNCKRQQTDIKSSTLSEHSASRDGDCDDPNVSKQPRSQSSNMSTASIAESSMEQSSLEQLSLEQSIAESSVGESVDIVIGEMIDS